MNGAEGQRLAGTVLMVPTLNSAPLQLVKNALASSSEGGRLLKSARIDLPDAENEPCILKLELDTKSSICFSRSTIKRTATL